MTYPPAPSLPPYIDPATISHLADNAFDLMGIVRDGRFVGVNRAFQRVLGWPPQEITSRPFIDFVHPDDIPATMAAYQSLLRGQPLVDFENRYRHQDGGWRWLQWRAGRLPDGRVHGVARDVTAHRRERQLIERTHHIARVGGWQLDFASRDVYWTAGTYRLHELDPATFDPDIDACLALFIGDDRHRAQAALDAIQRDATPFDIEARVRTGDGRIILVRIEGNPVIEGDRVTGAFGAVGDITERRRAERLHRQMKAVLEASPQAVIFASPDRIVQWVNPAAEALLGLDEAVIGTPTRALFTPWAHGLFDVEIGVALTQQGVWQGESEARHTSGEGIPVASTVVLHRDRDGQPGFLSLTLDDLRDKRQLENQVRHGQRVESVGRLAGGLAHDFNNLLTVMLANGEELTEALAGSELRPLVEEIIDAARRGSNLTRRLLTFARRDVTRPQAVDLLAACLDAARMLRRTLGERIGIAVEPGRENWPVLIDPTHLEQVLINLAMNARDAMPDGGQITFRLSARPGAGPRRDRMRLRVIDTGQGMAPDVAERAFDPFFTTKGRDQGTGLGLSTCRSVVEQAGGAMTIHSAPGAGTTIEVELPRAPARSGAASLLPGSAEAPGGEERILFIEDEPDIRRTVTKGLRRRGYRVDAFASAEDTLTWLEDAPQPDLIVTDVVLPGMDGPSAVRLIRERLGDIPVIFTSGYAIEKLASLDLDRPAVRFLRKPYTPRQLGPVMRQLLG